MSTGAEAKKIITQPVIASYPHLFEPQPDDNGKLFYSVSLVFPPDYDPKHLQEIKDEAMRVGKAKWPNYTPGPSFHFPFRTDAEAKGYPAGSTFISAKTKQKPGVVSRYAGPDGKPQAITDPDAVYPGVLIRASIRFFTFDTGKKKGVGVALNNVQVWADGDRLDNRMKAEDEFDADESAGDPNALLD